jgi:hypothetical protein
MPCFTFTYFTVPYLTIGEGYPALVVGNAGVVGRYLELNFWSDEAWDAGVVIGVADHNRIPACISMQS